MSYKNFDKIGNEMLVYLDKKNSYGRDLYYPDCERSKKLASFRGCKSFTLDDVKQINDIGITIKFREITLSMEMVKEATS